MGLPTGEIEYQTEPALSAEEFVDILQRSGLAARRPVDHPDRIEKMLRHATLVVTARHRGLLVGICRALSDLAYVTYISDLAVDEGYQRRGIGRQLLDYTHAAAGHSTRLVLLAAPAATDYYPHIGMSRHESCWTRPPVSAATD
jgi:ribosomal protein S18 acetylase RimI-like enzyme